MAKEKSKEKVIVPKVLITYTDAGNKQKLSIITVDKKGEIIKKNEIEKALVELKKFVDSL